MRDHSLTKAGEEEKSINNQQVSGHVIQEAPQINEQTVVKFSRE